MLSLATGSLKPVSGLDALYFLLNFLFQKIENLNVKQNVAQDIPQIDGKDSYSLFPCYEMHYIQLEHDYYNNRKTV